MRPEKNRLLRRFSGIVFTAAALTMTPAPLAADVATASQSGFLDLAGSAYVSFTVNQDGSITGSTSQPFGGWQIEFNNNTLPCTDNQQFSQCTPALYFPGLPAGSVIDSATLNVDLQATPYFNVGSENLIAGVEGSPATTFVALGSSACGPLGEWGSLGPFISLPPSVPPLPANDTVSFAPCTTGPQSYNANFQGGGSLTLVANTAGGYDPGTGNFNPPLGPGEYDVGYNIAVGGEYTVTEDYHLNPAVPEPRTYAF